MKVTLTQPEVAGSYIVAERRKDGTLVLKPAPVGDATAEIADRALSERRQAHRFQKLDDLADSH